MKALILTLALCLTPAHASVDTTDTSSTAECEDTREVHAQSLTDLESALTDLLGETDAPTKQAVASFASLLLESSIDASYAIAAKDAAWLQDNVEQFIDSAHTASLSPFADLIFPVTADDMDAMAIAVANQQFVLIGDALVEGKDVDLILLNWLESNDDSPDDSGSGGRTPMMDPDNYCGPDDLISKDKTRVEECCDKECTETRTCEITTARCAHEYTNEAGEIVHDEYNSIQTRCTECVPVAGEIVIAPAD